MKGCGVWFRVAFVDLNILGAVEWLLIVVSVRWHNHLMFHVVFGLGDVGA